MRRKPTPIKILFPLLALSLMAAIFLNTAAYHYKTETKNSFRQPQVKTAPSHSSALPDVALFKKILQISIRILPKTR